MMRKSAAASKIEAMDPHNCINSRLRRLARMTTHIYERELNKFGLRSSQISILLMVAKSGSTNQKQVAEFLFIDQSTMSRDLTKLTVRGLIKITKGNDARHSQLELTHKGHHLLEEVVPAWEQVQDMIEKTLGSFTLNNIDVMTEGLKQHTRR